MPHLVNAQDVVQHMLSSIMTRPERLHLLTAQNKLGDVISGCVRWGAYMIAAWLAGLVILLLAGMLLSRLTLIAAHRTRPGPQFATTRGERILHSIYRVVIVMASLYYYVSVLVLVLTVIGATAFGTLLALSVRNLFFIVIAMVGVYLLMDIFRSVFALSKYQEAERALSREEAPELWAVVEQVAERLNTRTVDAVCIRPGASISVVERGSLLQKLSGAGQRCLFLGFGLLAFMTQGQFRSILAHEYGHFSVSDTLADTLSWHVRLQLNRMVERLTATRQRHWSHPMWVFVWLFGRMFARITQGASRLCEILADRYAVTAYGADAFAEGITHLVRAGLAFRLRLPQQVEVSIRTGIPLGNLYRATGFPPPLQREFEHIVAEQMNWRTSPYDSHPAPNERIRIARQLGTRCPEPASEASVWDLFQNPEKLQEEMMDIIRPDMRTWAAWYGLRWH
jgi:Zn-dependent protease with chaperone function